MQQELNPQGTPRDPIVDEVRRAREEHASRFDYDLDAIVRDLKKQETSDREIVVLEPKPAERIKGAA